MRAGDRAARIASISSLVDMQAVALFTRDISHRELLA